MPGTTLATHKLPAILKKLYMINPLDTENKIELLKQIFPLLYVITNDNITFNEI